MQSVLVAFSVFFYSNTRSQKFKNPTTGAFITFDYKLNNCLLHSSLLQESLPLFVLLQQWVKRWAQPSKRKTDKISLHCSLNYLSEGTTETSYVHSLLIPHYQLSLTGRNISGHKTFIKKQPPWHVNLGCRFYSVIQICLLFMSKNNGRIENKSQEMLQKWPGTTPVLFRGRPSHFFPFTIYASPFA